MSTRLGIDIGGTFTDATLINDETGAVWIAKVLSTPTDPSLGVMAATERILGDLRERGNGVLLVVPIARVVGLRQT